MMAWKLGHGRHAAPARRRVAWRDLVGDALAGILGRPARMALTVLGTVVGVAALVATMGLSATAGNQIVGRFDALAATDIVVAAKIGGGGRVTAFLPWDAEARLLRLNGVVAAGTLSDVDAGGALIRAVPIRDPQSQTEFQLPLQAASPGLFAAVRAELSDGRTFDAGHSLRGDRVVVLGRNVAEKFNIANVDQQPAIFIGDQPYVVLGIIDRVHRHPSLLGSVVLPEGTARREFGLVAPGSAQIETDVGAARLVANEAPIALSPNEPTALQVTSPPEPRRVRANVQGDLDAVFLLLGFVSLAVGALGIANMTLVGVMERVGEIGLRRALGASRGQIAAQFLLESTLLGLIGGMLGSALGTLGVVAVAAAQTWTPVLPAWAPFAAPLLGAGVGLVAGLYPSVRAARMEPVEALRAGV